jgi:hypothetical protein
LLVQLIVGSGAELMLHLVLGVGFLLTAFAVFDFEPPRWLLSQLLRLALLLPFVWLLLESSKKIPLPETARRA